MLISPLENALNIKREIESSEFTAPIFLTGCMRSGTTYLASLVSEHPNILHLEGELNNIWTEIGGIDCLHDRKYADRSHVEAKYISNMSAYFQRCYQEFTKSKYGIWRRILNLKNGSGGIAKAKNDLVLLNKSVHFINRTDYLLNMFPNARVILIIRPIESQVNSIKRHFEIKEKIGQYFNTPTGKESSWNSRKDQKERKWTVEDLANKWIDLNITAIHDLKRNNESSYNILRYEDLVEKPEAVLKSLYSFLGKDYAAGHFKNLEKRKIFNSHTKGNPLTDWEKMLNKEEVNVINKIKEERRAEYDEIQSAFSQ